MAFARESGYLGQMRSLGGLWGRTGSPRYVNPLNLTVTTTDVLSVLSENQRRIAAIIINKGTGSLDLDLGGSGAYSITLGVNDVLQIDESFPWTGVVNGLAITSNCTVWVSEVSIE